MNTVKDQFKYTDNLFITILEFEKQVSKLNSNLDMNFKYFKLYYVFIRE